jgi:uncharacterized protein (DUF1697 family)
MPVVISMLRGINVGGHKLVKMDALKILYASLDLQGAQTYVQSGNVVFKTKERNLTKLGKAIEDAIERSFGFRCDVVLRTAAEIKEVIAKNPFARRRGLDPSKLLVTFLAEEPDLQGRDDVLKLQPGSEELEIHGREMFIYFPDGMGRSKVPWARIGKMLGSTGTGRNWNTVTKLLDMAEAMERPSKAV